MLVQSFEVVEGNRRMITEGDIPDEQARQLRIGDIIRLARVTAHTQQIVFGSTATGNRDSIPVEEYVITERFDRNTQFGMPFIEITIEPRF